MNIHALASDIARLPAAFLTFHVEKISAFAHEVKELVAVTSCRLKDKSLDLKGSEKMGAPDARADDNVRPGLRPYALVHKTSRSEKRREGFAQRFDRVFPLKIKVLMAKQFFSVRVKEDREASRRRLWGTEVVLHRLWGCLSGNFVPIILYVQNSQ